jgi:hypothetical protein
MAVYQGARPRTLLLPRRPGAVDGPAVPRRRVRSAVRAKRNARRTGLLLGGIVVTFLLAFFSLAQSVRVSATGYDINQLLIDQEQLLDRRRELLSDLNRLGREPAIRKLSIDAGLGQLPESIVLPGR